MRWIAAVYVRSLCMALTWSDLSHRAYRLWVICHTVYSLSVTVRSCNSLVPFRNAERIYTHLNLKIFAPLIFVAPRRVNTPYIGHFRNKVGLLSKIFTRVSWNVFFFKFGSFIGQYHLNLNASFRYQTRDISTSWHTWFLVKSAKYKIILAWTKTNKKRITVEVQFWKMLVAWLNLMLHHYTNETERHEY